MQLTVYSVHTGVLTVPPKGLTPITTHPTVVRL